MATPSYNPTASLQAALRNFESILSTDEKKMLCDIKAIPDADAAIQFTARLDQANAKRRGVSLGSRVYSMLLSVQQFANVVGTFVSSHPEIAALVWGSMQLTMLITANFTSYFQELSRILQDYGSWSPRFDECRSLFPFSTQLQAAVCDFHAALVDCCRAILVMTRRSWGAHLIQSLTTSFEAEVQSHAKILKEKAKRVRFAIKFSKDETDLKEQKLQEQERKSASNHRRFLSTIMSNEFKKAQEWRTQVDVVRTGEKMQQILDLISTYDPVPAYKQAQSKRHPGTGEWLTNSSELIHWKSANQSSVLFLSGKIGSGKTILAANVVDHLLSGRSTSQAVFFFFPRFDNRSSLQAETILRSIIRQWMHQDHVTKDFQDAFEEAQKSLFSPQALQKLLYVRLSMFSSNFIIIDAVDEFDHPERQSLLEVLGDIVRASSLVVKLLVVGRSMEDKVKKLFPQVKHISMDTAPVARDLEHYTRQCLKERLWIGQVQMGDEHLLEKVCQALTKGAEGMFLWVALEIEDICSQVCEEDILQALQNLPRGLTEVLDRALGRIIRQKNERIAKEVFKWLSVAARPLRLEELEDVLSIRVGDVRIIPERRILAIERIAVWCANLVEVDQISSEVQFIHHTVKQFILDTTSSTSSNRRALSLHGSALDYENNVCELCITYLNLDDLKMTVARVEPPSHLKLPCATAMAMAGSALGSAWKGPMTTPLATMAIRHQAGNRPIVLPSKEMTTFERRHEKYRSIRKFPFLSYAKEYWLLHSSTLCDASSLQSLWRKMASGSHEVAQPPWTREAFLQEEQSIIEWATEKRHIGLFKLILATWTCEANSPWPLVCEISDFGILESLITHPLWSDESTYWTNEFLCRQLYLPVEDSGVGLSELRLRPNIVQMATQKLSSFMKETLLYTCMQYNHHNYLDIFIQNDPQRWGILVKGVGLSDLRNSIDLGHWDLVDTLLRYGACSSQLGPGETLLHLAAKEDSSLLLHCITRDLNINAVSKSGHTPLHLAIQKLQTPCAKILLDRGANVNSRNALGWTPLLEATHAGNPELVQLLCDAGADISARTDAGQTAYKLAMYSSDPSGSLDSHSVIEILTTKRRECLE
ncbi:hypothetical protein F4805DRAFT_270567 [Annulohypoxylon moriforme]|nr:hypothetical protein F4805DRAFT_270567 [Annulohypoxylon moriforme]